MDRGQVVVRELVIVVMVVVVVVVVVAVGRAVLEQFVLGQSITTSFVCSCSKLAHKMLLRLQ